MVFLGKRTSIVIGVIAIVFFAYLFVSLLNVPENTVRVIGDTGKRDLASGLSNELENNGKNREIKNVVEMTSEGFSPLVLEISVGGEVIFVNSGQVPMWPATDIHPTHKIYPDSNIDKCGTSKERNIFDACKGISAGEEYAFTFNEVGTWKYHDHLHPWLKGEIIVK